MKVRYLHFADYCNACGDGALNIMGIRDTIDFAHMPIVCPEFFIVFGIDTYPDDMGANREVHVQLLDPEGSVMNEMRCGIAPTAPRQAVHLRHPMHGLRFESVGVYEVTLNLDSEIVASMSLQVRTLARTAGTL